MQAMQESELDLMSKMKIATLRFKKSYDGNWSTELPHNNWPAKVCYQGLYAVMKRSLKEKCYDVSFYNRKPRGQHFKVELKGYQYRRVGSKKWNRMNFDLQYLLSNGDHFYSPRVVYFKIKPVKQ